MRTLTKLVPLALIGGAVAVQVACGTVPTDSTNPGNEFPPAGVIRGTLFYSGPPPCTQNGQVVGNAVILVFDARNPPPPAGIANTAVNFGVVSGDVLFATLPRTAGPDKVCPLPGAASVTASATYAISPMNAGSYVMQGFFDTTGDFLPTFKFRNLPESGDVGGGYIDVNDAQKVVPNQAQAKNVVLSDGGILNITPSEAQGSDPNYQPIFLPVNIGIPGAVSPTSLRGVPDFSMPSNGYVADNVTISLGQTLSLARPYFYPLGAVLPKGQKSPDGVVVHGDSATRPTTVLKSPANPDGNIDFQPVLSFPQDIRVYAKPGSVNQKLIDPYQASFPQLQLQWGVPAVEQPIAADISKPGDPFHMQLVNPPAAGAAPGGNNGLYVWWDGTLGGFGDPLLDLIPEGQVPRLWPLIVLAKLEDDPDHTLDPESVTYQGSDLKKPVVIIQGITLTGDSLFSTAEGSPLFGPDPSNLQDHVSVMLRPSALCLDPRHVDQGGVLVTPYQCGFYPPGDATDGTSKTCAAGATGTTPLGNIVPDGVITNPQLTSLIKQTSTNGVADGLQYACLPTGRYGINMVYPTGQAWTTPNEIGSCAAAEGTTSFPKSGDLGNCSLKSRPVLYSQGTRAVVEITPSTTGACKAGSAVAPVPTICTTLTGN